MGEIPEPTDDDFPLPPDVHSMGPVRAEVDFTRGRTTVAGYHIRRFLTSPWARKQAWVGATLGLVDDLLHDASRGFCHFLDVHLGAYDTPLPDDD